MEIKYLSKVGIFCNNYTETYSVNKIGFCDNHTEQQYLDFDACATRRKHCALSD